MTLYDVTYGGGVNVQIGGNTDGVTALIATGTLTLAGGNNITLSQVGNGITFIGAGGAGGAFTAGMSNLGNTLGTTGVVQSQLVLAGGNNIVLSQSINGNSATITISASNQSVQTQNLHNLTLAGNTAGVLAQVSSGTLTLAGGNNIILSQAGNAITISASNQSVQTQNLFDLTLAGNTAGVLALVSSGTLTLAGGNNIILSQAGNAITISASAQSAESQSIGMNSSTAGGGTGGTSGYASGAQVRYDFYAGSNITLSGSVNGASGSLSIYGTSGATARLSMFMPFQGGATATGQDGQSAVFFQPFTLEQDLSFSVVHQYISMSLSTSSNSSHAGRISVHMGVYSRNGSSLSLVSSSSVAHVWTNTSNNSTSVLSGLKVMSCPLAANLTPGDYFLGYVSFTGTVNANWFTASNLFATALTVANSGYLGSAVNNTNAYYPGHGVYSALSAAMPNAVAFSEITQAGRTKVAYFLNFAS